MFADLFARAAAICKANLIKPYVKTGACPGPEGGKMRGEGKRRQEGICREDLFQLNGEIG